MTSRPVGAIQVGRSRQIRMIAVLCCVHGMQHGWVTRAVER